MALGETTTRDLDGTVTLIKKANKADTQQVVTSEPGLLEDEFQSLYFTPKKNTNVIVEPPFNPLQLASLVHRNNVLAQCISAMEINIDGSGYTFDLLDAEEDKVTGDENIKDDGNKLNAGKVKDDNASGLPQNNDKDVSAPVQKVVKAFGQSTAPAAPQAPQAPIPPQPPEQPPQTGTKPLNKTSTATSISRGDDPSTEVVELDPELEMLEHFFNEPFPGMSFTTIRRKLRVDMESTGNGYLEVIRNMAGEVVFVRHLESVTMRLVKLDAPTNVEVTVTRGGKEVKATLPMRERRFAYKIGAHLVYYREFGSSRQVNRKTGAWIEPESDDNKNIELLGSEVLHFSVYKDFRTHYGMPRWINQLPSIMGSRKAEEFNLEFFDAGGLPPAIIFVQGGALVGGVKEQLQQYLSGKASSKHRAAIVEVMSTSGSLDSSGTVSVKVERFGACLDNQSEVLTDKGWIFIKDWNGELVASVENHTLVYHKPSQYHVYDYDGFLHHIEGHATEFMVTPNHRVYYEYQGSYRLEAASNTIKRSNVRIPVAPLNGYAGGFKSEFNVARGAYSEGTFLDFLGMFIADGATTKNSESLSLIDGNQNSLIVFSVKKNRKKDFILSFMPTIAKEAKVELYAKDLTREGYTRFSIFSRDLRDWLRDNVGTYAVNKRIPSEFLKLNQMQSERLLMALLNGDGHYNGEFGKHGWTYTTVSPQLANDVQTLCLHSGYRSVFSKVKDREEYCISITPKTFAHVTNGKCPKWESVYYTDKVYCFTMPTGLFVSRRNGKVCITGNSASDMMFTNYDAVCGEHVRKSFRLPKIMIGDAETSNRAVTEAAIQAAENQIFQPERFHFDEIINNSIVKALGAKRYKIRSLNMTVSDPEMQLNTLKAAWNLIDGETYVETANEISGLDMKYSAEAEQANKPPAPGGMPGGDPMGGDPNDPNGAGDPSNDPNSDMGSPPGQFDDGSQGGQQGSMLPPQNSLNKGTPRVPMGMQGDPNAGSELGQAPYSGSSYKVEKSERFTPTEIVKLVNDWTIAMGLTTGTMERDLAEVLHQVASLKNEDRTFFDQIVVKKMFKEADHEVLDMVVSCSHNHKD